MNNKKKLFGTIGGVFTPCLLTILGVILFLRTGMVIGYSGLWHALFILLLAKTISILTSISLSAIATNAPVKSGGAYFFISRSLGAEFGGAIGIAFFLAQAISVALYVIGFSATVGSVFQIQDTKMVGVITAIILFVFTYIGASWVIKIQYFVMTALLISIGAFFVGGYISFDVSKFSSNLVSNYSKDINFWLAFAIFFPAVTGIMAGANMSGDLKEPSKSLPKGTFAAVFVTGLVYMATFIVLAGSATREHLQNDTFIFEKIAMKGTFFINMGIFCATLSSALGSFVGAPRILQALAKDQIFPSINFFGVGSGINNEPRRAMFLTFFIAIIGILFCDLNVIAPVITMFFLITYGTLNFAAFYETKADNPSFRPTFKIYHWLTGFLGAIGCVGVMFLIHPLAAFIALIIIYAMYKYTEKKDIKANWGDVKSGFLFKKIRNNLMSLENLETHPKNWRPKVLVLSGNPRTRSRLVTFASWLEGQKGLLFVSNIIVTQSYKSVIPYIESQKKSIKKFMKENKFEGIVEVMCSQDYESGFFSLLQGAGIGQLSPNTILLGLCEDPEKYEPYVKTLNICNMMGKNILILKLDTMSQIDIFDSIDIWWRGRENGELMILYAFLLKQNIAWENARIRIMRIVENEAGKSKANEHLKALAKAARLSCEIKIIISQRPPMEVINEESSGTDVVFLGIGEPKEGEERLFAEKLNTMTEGKINTILVKSNADIDIMV